VTTGVGVLVSAAIWVAGLGSLAAQGGDAAHVVAAHICSACSQARASDCENVNAAACLLGRPDCQTVTVSPF
jgi:hypothetical protein